MTESTTENRPTGKVVEFTCKPGGRGGARRTAPSGVRGGVPAPDPFQPNRAQRRFLRLALADGEGLAVNALCREAEVSPRCYESWCAQPGFNAWMAAALVRQVQRESWWLLQSARAQAGRSEMHWRVLAQLVSATQGGPPPPQ